MINVENGVVTSSGTRDELLKECCLILSEIIADFKWEVGSYYGSKRVIKTFPEKFYSGELRIIDYNDNSVSSENQ